MVKENVIIDEVRAAQKKAQLARLAAKGTPEYPALYASQPEQIRKAAEQGAIRKAERDAKNALRDAMQKSANEAVEIFGNLEVK